MGRTEDGGRDVALPREALDEIGKAQTGGGVRIVPQSALGSDVGRARFRSGTNIPTDIEISRDVSVEKRPLVAAHEIGHVIDQVAGNPGRLIEPEVGSSTPEKPF